MARFVSGVSRFSHVSTILKSLHWLLLNNKSFWKSCYSYTNSLILESQNSLPHICLYIHLLLRQDVIQQRCSSKSPSLVPQFINLKFISTSPFHMMAQNSLMICHWKFELLQHYHVSQRDLKPICFRSLFLLSFPCYRTPMILWWQPCYGLWLMIYALWFGWCALESVSSEIKHMDTWYLILISTHYFPIFCLPLNFDVCF